MPSEEPGASLTPEEARLRPTYAVVRRSRLRDNLRAVKRHVGRARVMAILKANAYGHGLEAVARCLDPEADAFGVALVEEGIALRRLGIRKPILVFGGVWTRQIPLFLDHGLTLTVPSLARLRDVEEAAAARPARVRVHLKIDTGMERLGVHHYNADGLLEAAARSPHVEVEGIYSHFANADAEDLTDARRQLARFQEVLRFYERRSLPVPERHMASSAALLRLPESHLDLVRPGILLYGVYPYGGRPPRGRGAARLVLAIPRRLLQGGRGGKSGELRVDLEERPQGPRRHHPGWVRRRILSQHVEPGPGDSSRTALRADRTDLHGPDHGEHRVGHRLQR